MKPINILSNAIKIFIGTVAAIYVTIFGTMQLSKGESNARSAGPGMIVTYVSTIKGVSVSVKNARLPNGKEFPNSGTFGYAEDILAGGKTEGAAPDGRQLPEWIEFEWSQPPAPEDPRQTLEEYRALPRKTQRVFVRNRVPQDVIDEVIESNRRQQNGRLSDKALWIYFIWTDDGIKLHWRLWYRPAVGAPSFPREGGDPLLVAPNR